MSPRSSEERLDDIIYVEPSQVGVLLPRADKENRLPCLVAHGQGRTHLTPKPDSIAREAGQQQ